MYRFRLVATIAVAFLQSLALGQSPDDLALGSHTRDAIEEMFRLEKGSLVIPSDGEYFQRAIKKSAWSTYARTGMQVSESVTLAGDMPLLCPPTTDLVVFHFPESGLYHQQIFSGNELGITGELTAVVGISGNKIVGCNYEDVTDPPEPLVPIGGEDELACTGPFLADLNDATCSYAQDGDNLAFDVLTPIVLGDSMSSRMMYTREWVSFSDLDIFAETDPNGNTWPQWILDNRDEVYDEGRTSYPCIKKGKKWKKKKFKAVKATRAPRAGRRKRNSQGDSLMGI